MYNITEELNTEGFSTNPAHELIKRHRGIRSFNNLEYFIIHIVMSPTEIIVDNQKYALSKGNLVFISPGKNFTVGPEYSHEGTVYEIAFSASFYERSANDSALLNSELFFSPSSEIQITKASMHTDEIQKLIIARLALYRAKNNTGFYISAAHNCVEALLLDGLLYIEQNQTNNIKVKKLTSFDVVNRFRVMLQKNYKKERSVAFYAEQLYVTPRRLSDMTEDVLGKSSKQVIVEKIVSESIRILKHSSFTISQVAYELGFNDEGNFSTFIKKHTNKSPKKIREEG